MGPNALAQQGGIVGHIDTPERSNEPIYADAARVASGEKSFVKEPAQGLPTIQTLAAAMISVRVRSEFGAPLLEPPRSKLVPSDRQPLPRRRPEDREQGRHNPDGCGRGSRDSPYGDTYGHNAPDPDQ